VRVDCDSEADAIYIALREPDGSAETEFIDGARCVGCDEAGKAVGIELLGVSQGIDLSGLPEAAKLPEALNAIPHPDPAVV